MLTQNVKEIIDISESTLYPVLRRLHNNDYVKLNTSVEQSEYNYNISSGVGDLVMYSEQRVEEQEQFQVIPMAGTKWL